MKRISAKRILCLAAAAMLMFSAGCGNQGVGTGEPDSSQGNAAKIEGEDDRQQEASLGRYVEKEIDLSEVLEEASGFQMMPDGKIVITEKYQNLQVSEDQGETWKEEGSQWLKKRNLPLCWMSVWERMAHWRLFIMIMARK